MPSFRPTCTWLFFGTKSIAAMLWLVAVREEEFAEVSHGNPICVPIPCVRDTAFEEKNFLLLTMVMETPGPQDVGREFVRQYYTMLHEAPLQLHRFYSNNSAFVHGGVEKAGNEQPPVIGQEAIHKKIVSLNFNDCHAKIRQVDAQATVGDSVVVQVTGELSNSGEPMRRFMQTFVLVPQTPKKFYVHNDIFRYQDEVFHDEDGEVEESDRFVTDPREEQENGTVPEPVPVSPDVSTYYDQVPLSNGTSHVDVEPIKAPEASPALVPSPPQPAKPEPEAVVTPVPVPEEPAPASASLGSQEPEPAASPAVEPTPPVEFNEPPPENKPVTWAALASKNTSGGAAPPVSSYPVQGLGHISKPPPMRSDGPKISANPSQAPQGQRAPRAPRERFADRDRNMMNRGDGDADVDNINGRRSNSVGGGGMGGSKYPDSQQVFVGNLPTNVSEAELKTFFEHYGKVEELRINTKSAGKVPNFGFVVFESPETVTDILKIEEILFNGKHRLNVEEKKPRNSDSRGGGRGGMSRGGMGGGPGMGRSGGPYNDRGGPGRAGSMKGGFNNRQDMRGSPNLGPRGGMGQQGRR
ncbi:ras GTPase-activating protein-binding protein 2 [Plakobranchus ocellatus]|uniref:Ras GTPase-activating protein-binding protein 2 n=1 Tax=Plakobranchus ocellatus TaxID=259542 RepID=A0AAV4BHG5_9GAST|nr:ras GTPase-activating protein-binding protein 2 [Plakobranchus ocellatus]